MITWWQVGMYAKKIYRMTGKPVHFHYIKPSHWEEVMKGFRYED